MEHSPVEKGCLIVDVEDYGSARQAGLLPGDRLLSIDGNPVRDALDIMFYGAESFRTLKYLRDGKIHTRHYRSPLHPYLGITAEDLKSRACHNRCIFCFIDQLPSGLRRSLYFKDEDFRLSFLYGNYIPATNLTEEDIKRIGEQHLSPLYVSVHATDIALRRRLLGNQNAPDILPVLEQLKENRIRFHTQIVVIPGVNDGAALNETLETLETLYPALLSIAIVPVGLTAHRKGLPELRHVTPRYARNFIPSIRKKQRRIKSKYGANFLFLSDEFYLLAGERPPAYYGIEEIPQMENGVGMVADFYRGFSQVARRLPERINPSRRIAFVTATMGSLALKRLIDRLNKIHALTCRAIVVKNELFGHSITVSGLMTGRDIMKVIKTNRGFDLYLLPANCLREDDAFLDDLTLRTLRAKTGTQIEIAPPRATDVIQTIMAKLSL